MRTVSYQTENNKETATLKEDQMEILDLKSAITQMKNSLQQQISTGRRKNQHAWRIGQLTNTYPV